MAKVKTDKGASNILDQAFSSLESQLERAGIPQAECDRQCDDFVRTIYAECMRIGSQFYPTLPEREDGDESPNGAA